VLALRATARRVLALSAEIDELERELAMMVKQWAPQLLAHTGVGVVVAAQLLVSWSHRGRVRSEAAFAMLAGVAPLPASSGTVVRYRLNRTGDRALNRALHLAVLSRIAYDDETKAYVARRLAEGKTKPEIRRCIKAPPRPPPLPGHAGPPRPDLTAIEASDWSRATVRCVLSREPLPWSR
jgi:transposase